MPWLIAYEVAASTSYYCWLLQQLLFVTHFLVSSRQTVSVVRSINDDGRHDTNLLMRLSESGAAARNLPVWYDTR